MRIRKAQLPKDVLEMINLYRSKTLSEIKKIEARWACGIYKKHSLYPMRKSEGYEIYYVKLNELIESADFGEMMYKKLNPKKLLTGIYERDFRVVKILDCWSKGGYIDPPEICLNSLQQISFGDGRHRTIVAFHLGEKYIPVVVHSSLFDKISKVIQLKKTKNKTK